MRWQEQHVSHLCRFGHKDVLNHHKIERLKAAADQSQIGFCLKRIFPMM